MLVVSQAASLSLSLFPPYIMEVMHLETLGLLWGVRMKQSDETSWGRGGVRSHKMGVCESVSKKKRGGRGYGCA